MGRPKMDEKDKKTSVNVTLDKGQIEKLREIGKGNVSEGVRKLMSLVTQDKNKLLKY